MTRIQAGIGAMVVGLLLAPSAASAQTSTTEATASHTIVVKLIERPGSMPFAFEPLTFTAHRGDTLRFVQAASAVHNVRFKTQARGAKLGAAAIGPYLTAPGQAYTLVVDNRFAEGKYEIVCDPHEAIGMHAILTVSPSTVPAGNQ